MNALATRMRADTRATYQWLRGRPLSCRLRGDSVAAQFIRFVLVGGASNIVYAALFLALRSEGAVLANAIGVAVSTVLANELHRRLTFNAKDRVGWIATQWEAGGLALVGLALSSFALAGVALWMPGLSALWQAVMVIAVSGLVGAGRFLALRGWVFSVRRDPNAQDAQPQEA